MAALFDAIQEQMPDAGWIAGHPEVAYIPGGCTPQTAGSSLNLGWVADVVLAAVAHATAPSIPAGWVEKEERAHGVTIDQRDAAEEALSQAFYLVTGRSPKWSNVFGYPEALEEIGAALAPAPSPVVEGGDQGSKSCAFQLASTNRPPLDEPESAAGLALVATTCFECGHDLEGPWCPACNPPRSWQPIETAPRDGTALLASSIHHNAVEVVCWQDGETSGSLDNLRRDDPLPEQGWVNDGPLKDRFYANPRWFTHWQPLPPAPAPPAQGVTGGAEPCPACLGEAEGCGVCNERGAA